MRRETGVTENGPEERISYWVRSVAPQEWILLALLVVLAAAAWAVTVYASGAAMGMGLTMGLTAPIFLAVWVGMMAAMMLPSMSPMVLIFARVTRARRAQGQSFVPTWIFVAGYLVVWSAAGFVAFLLAQVVQNAAMDNTGLMQNGPRLAGLLFVGAAAYQFSSLKRICLSKCRSPLTFVMTFWRDGYGGALQMGIRHGIFCLGCCWLLFAILFPLGIMSIPAMAVVAALVFAEKILPAGLMISRVLGFAMGGYGALVLLAPQYLPTSMM